MKQINKGVFYRVPCFNEEGSKELAQRVLSFKEHFTERNKITDEIRVNGKDIDEPTKFYTLGTSTYLDMENAHGKNAEFTNNLLLENFGDMYQVLVPCLEGALNEKIMLMPGFNIPGFHIFNTDELPSPGVENGGSVHRDYPDYSAEFDFKYIRPISFTLMLQAPANGAGMNYWDDERLSEEITYFQTFCGMDEDMFERVKLKAKYFEYNIGELVIHDGQTLHQVANMVNVEKGEHRVSIQGHCVLTNEGYVIYF